ncbi:hypothetical protein GR215_34390 [Rhizobium leguminosarum]|uniref:hypothetical protein n=1 Tax=Rhizobium leguminosarum TaxID=384 RepID=UPI0013B79FC1|nr:hypothetical protein [Rhizobium leguminosarum]NEH46888.1 hypothetical protein [Rhizobium leguminosarum]
MWDIPTRPSSWLKVSRLDPVRILDEYEGPKLFTVAADDGQELLVYQCAEDAERSRFLLVPSDEGLISDLEANRIALRDALTRAGWSWIVDRTRDGNLTQPASMNTRDLPPKALPSAGVKLSLADDVLLRIRMVGRQLSGHRIPASVVKRTLDAATGAIRALSAHALEVGQTTGRPSDDFRKYYDLPAVEFGFRSFEIAFAQPDISSSLLEETPALDRVRELLSKGLSWAAASESEAVTSSPEWKAIIEALTKLTPPMKGVVETVEVSGILAGRKVRPVRLTRVASERVAVARKSFVPDERTRAYEGIIRELDKDKRRFILRDNKATDLCTVSFTEEQFDDVSLAFESDRLVSIVIYETVQPHELISVTLRGSDMKEDVGPSA